MNSEELPIEYKNLLMDPSNCCEKTYDKPVENEPIQEDAIAVADNKETEKKVI